MVKYQNIHLFFEYSPHCFGGFRALASLSFHLDFGVEVSESTAWQQREEMQLG